MCVLSTARQLVPLLALLSGCWIDGSLGAFATSESSSGGMPSPAGVTCASDSDCLSGICGISGTGHCCNSACGDTTPPCGAVDCDDAGACSSPGTSVTCGPALPSCSGSTQSDPSFCDGQGNCLGITDCAPFICGATACLTSCGDNTSCGPGDFCDTRNSTCCPSPASGGTLAVDAVTGRDDTSCCGLAGKGACRTLGHAMSLIDGARAPNLTISAAVNAAGGDWAPSAETYPIVLGWGVTLSAPGVYFLDPVGGHREIFNVAAYSASDAASQASIVGSPGNAVGIGMNRTNDQQSSDLSAIEIESGHTLFLANATVNGSASGMTTAITVAAGAGLTLGQDKSGGVEGTVYVGNDQDNPLTDGWNGIVCETDSVSLGCTIHDAPLTDQSSVVIQGQENLDLDVEDFGAISLTSAPIIGVAPAAPPGFLQCPGKPDGIAGDGDPSILLDGLVSMTFANGKIQCIAGGAFQLQPSPSFNGNPVLIVDATTIQNVGYGGIVALGGTVTVSNSTLWYNYLGVVASSGSSDSTYGVVDLGGGASGGRNTVVCSSGIESFTGQDIGFPAVAVLNDTPFTLDASHVDWDTPGPDQFYCRGSEGEDCDCELASCSDPAGEDGMDAVCTYAAGVILTTGNRLSAANCALP